MTNLPLPQTTVVFACFGCSHRRSSSSLLSFVPRQPRTASCDHAWLLASLLPLHCINANVHNAIGRSRKFFFPMSAPQGISKEHWTQEALLGHNIARCHSMRTPWVVHSPSLLEQSCSKAPKGRSWSRKTEGVGDIREGGGNPAPVQYCRASCRPHEEDGLPLQKTIGFIVDQLEGRPRPMKAEDS